MHTRDEHPVDDDDMLTPEEVGAMLSVSIHVLAKLRRTRRGPRSYKLSHRTVRYRRADVLAWLHDRASSSALPAPPSE
jgi:predicted DNA-binding transcriptional regulator AlpA